MNAVHTDNDLARAIQVESLSRRIQALTIKASRPKSAMKVRHDAVRDIAERIYKKAIAGVLSSAKTEVLKNLRQKRAGEGAVKAAEAKATTPTAVNFDLKTFTDRFLSSMASASEKAYEVCARGLTSKIGADEKVTKQGIIKKFVFDRANKVSGCPQEIFDQIQRTLTEGDAKGETMKELAARVQEEFDTIDKGRAFVIARTESQSAYGQAQFNVLDSEGYETKRWQSSDDELVRPSHTVCEDEGAIGIDEEFSNGLKFPGDPDGPADEVIGCRCYLVKGNPTDDGDESDDL